MKVTDWRDAADKRAVTATAETAGTVPASWFPPVPVEMCKCGREMFRHGRKTPNTLNGREVPCRRVEESEVREEFTSRYERTPWFRRWLLRTPEGW